MASSDRVDRDRGDDGDRDDRDPDGAGFPTGGGGAGWPSLPSEEWRDTCATLHLWTQIVGKIRLARMPWINHSWHVALYVTPRGLTTGAVPHGARSLQIDFDLIDHALRIATSSGGERSVELRPRTVASFYEEVMRRLDELGVPVTIHTTPNEIPDAIPFERDEEHSAYDPDPAGRFREALLQAARVLTEFRAGFRGKCSPVHFFWGGFDLAVTRFSGRRAPPHPGGIPNLPDWVTREAYSHEVSSAGFWPGGEAAPALFYSYAYPAPGGFAEASVRPATARFDPELQEFVLPYDVVRASEDPDAELRAFLQTTYEAAADTGGWDRDSLEARERYPPR